MREDPVFAVRRGAVRCGAVVARAPFSRAAVDISDRPTRKATAVRLVSVAVSVAAQPVTGDVRRDEYKEAYDRREEALVGQVP